MKFCKNCIPYMQRAAETSFIKRGNNDLADVP